ncbi:GNAT family N-acetyltransferase [Carnobacterium sp.]|uniref:GNAT family N-acetyltransferase n=1 Tax=Carnobacterium sp. TaxID=48221 RepID=UPI00388DD680
MESIKVGESSDFEEVRIELATAEDVDEIVAICTQGYACTAEAVKDKQKVQEKVEEYYNPKRILNEIEEVSAKWSGWIVARLDEKVIGVIGGGIVDSKVGKVFVLYVNVDYLRKGIGTRLVNHLTQMQQLLGNNTQLVSFLKSDKVSSQFYEALGFHYLQDIEDNENVEFTSIEMIRDI